MWCHSMPVAETGHKHFALYKHCAMEDMNKFVCSEESGQEAFEV